MFQVKYVDFLLAFKKVASLVGAKWLYLLDLCLWFCFCLESTVKLGAHVVKREVAYVDWHEGRVWEFEMEIWG